MSANNTKKTSIHSPPDWDPDIIPAAHGGALMKFGDRGVAILKAAVTGMNHSFAYDKIAEGAAALEAERAARSKNGVAAFDPVLMATFHAAAVPLYSRVVNEANAAIDAIVKIASGFAEDAEKALEHDGSRAAEVRSFLRGLSEDERTKIIDQAIADGDKATLGAVIDGAPAYLSGFGADPNDFVGVIRERALMRLAPEAHAGMAEAKRVTERLGSVGRSFETECIAIMNRLEVTETVVTETAAGRAAAAVAELSGAAAGNN